MQTLSIDRTKEWTAEDYLLLGETSLPCQLINGELIVSPAPHPQHQRTLKNLFRLMDACAHEGEVFFAPIDVYIDRKNVFQPDLLYLSKAGAHYLTDKGVEGPPDIIAEIIPPSNSYMDRYEKKDAYQAFGVKEYWIADPANRTLEVYGTENWKKPQLYLAGEGRVTSAVLPRLSFDLTEVFAGSK